MLIGINTYSQSSCVESREARGTEAGDWLTLAQHCASAFLPLPLAEVQSFPVCVLQTKAIHQDGTLCQRGCCCGKFFRCIAG